MLIHIVFSHDLKIFCFVVRFACCHVRLVPSLFMENKKLCFYIYCIQIMVFLYHKDKIRKQLKSFLESGCTRFYFSSIALSTSIGSFANVYNVKCTKVQILLGVGVKGAVL